MRVQHVYSAKGSQLVCIVYSRSSHAIVFEIFDSNEKKIYAVKCPKDENKARKLKLEILSVEKSYDAGNITKVVSFWTHAIC